MKFQYEGVEYDTEGMVAFPTRNRAMPFIYLTSDFSEVFVQTMDRVQGVVIRRALVEEITYLAQAHQLPVLLRAVQSQAEQSPPAPTPPPNPPDSSGSVSDGSPAHSNESNSALSD